MKKIPLSGAILCATVIAGAFSPAIVSAQTGWNVAAVMKSLNENASSSTRIPFPSIYIPNVFNVRQRVQTELEARVGNTEANRDFRNNVLSNLKNAQTLPTQIALANLHHIVIRAEARIDKDEKAGLNTALARARLETANATLNDGLYSLNIWIAYLESQAPSTNPSALVTDPVVKALSTQTFNTVETAKKALSSVIDEIERIEKR